MNLSRVVQILVVGKTLTWENGAKMLSFLYDSSGNPYSMVYCYTENSVKYSASYYYVTNLQGDVIALMNAQHSVVAEYIYDAWGNILSITNASGTDISGNATHIANLNPLRYRGYVYDNETGFYYLQSRYYDPVVGRFINVDNTLSGVNGPILGYNLFAYSFNNPINLDDSNGDWPKWAKNVVKAVVKTVNNTVKTVGRAATKIKSAIQRPVETSAKIAVSSAVAVATKRATVSDIIEDKNNFRLYNTNTNKCAEAKVFSSYNGTLVIKQNFLPSSCTISNTILLKDLDAQQDSYFVEQTIKHEWGHAVQETLLGYDSYISRIAIPSVIGCLSNKDNYYSQPWERSAEFFGGASSEAYVEGSEIRSTLYFLMQ